MTISSTPLTGADQVVIQGGVAYYGHVVKETAGSTATAVIYDDASGTAGGDATILAAISLPANGVVDVVHPRPIDARYGVYIDVLTGSIAGSVRTGARQP